MAQRLVRKICPHCIETYEPTEYELEQAKGVVKNFSRGQGCENCLQTGYSGRTGIYEIIAIDEDMRHMIGEGLSESEIIQNLKEKGFRMMWEDGLTKVDQGITSMAEVLRVTRV